MIKKHVVPTPLSGIRVGGRKKNVVYIITGSSEKKIYCLVVGNNKLFIYLFFRYTDTDYHQKYEIVKIM
jgi:hypothetical protein